MTQKYLVHPNQGPGFGRWLVAASENNGKLSVTDGPSWLKSTPMDASHFIEYKGDLEPQDLGREKHLALCAELGFHPAKPQPFFTSAPSARTSFQTAETKKPETVEDFVLKSLYGRGLFEDQAKAVVELVKQSPLLKSMERRWDDKATDYPPQALQAAMLTVDFFAVQWIDDNKPEHWARPMFALDNN